MFHNSKRAGPKKEVKLQFRKWALRALVVHNVPELKTRILQQLTTKHNQVALMINMQSKVEVEGVAP